MVKYFKYHPGKFLAAWEPKSSTENERTTVVVEHKNGQQVLFRQIAGALARRIVWYCKEGDSAKQCEEFGFIKLRVSDNGPGIDVASPQEDSLGNILIEEFSKQLNAKMEIDGTLGTTYLLEFKK